MGAGSQTDHFHQDGGEKYIVFKLQELAVKNGTALTDSVDHKKLDFDNHCKGLGITESFKKTIYCTNVDKWVESVYNDYVSLYPNEKFDFVNVEKEFRDKGLKGDYILQFEDREVSQGLKNQKEHNKAQMCSGTWNSGLNNFLFESAGSGMFYVPNKKIKWKGSKVSERDFFVKEEGYEELHPIYHRMDEINAKMKQFYVYGEEARFYYNIEQQLNDDRKNYGKEISSLMVEALDIIGKDKVTARVKKMTGLDAAEELLALSLELDTGRHDAPAVPGVLFATRALTRMLAFITTLMEQEHIEDPKMKTRGVQPPPKSKRSLENAKERVNKVISARVRPVIRRWLNRAATVSYTHLTLPTKA